MNNSTLKTCDIPNRILEMSLNKIIYIFTSSSEDREKYILKLTTETKNNGNKITLSIHTKHMTDKIIEIIKYYVVFINKAFGNGAEYE